MADRVEMQMNPVSFALPPQPGFPSPPDGIAKNNVKACVAREGQRRGKSKFREGAPRGRGRGETPASLVIALARGARPNRKITVLCCVRPSYAIPPHARVIMYYYFLNCGEMNNNDV